MINFYLCLVSFVASFLLFIFMLFAKQRKEHLALPFAVCACLIAQFQPCDTIWIGEGVIPDHFIVHSPLSNLQV